MAEISEKALLECRDKWRAIALSSSDICDHKVAEDCIKIIYSENNLKEPKIIWLRSPLEGERCAELCKPMDAEDVDVKQLKIKVQKTKKKISKIHSFSYGNLDAAWLSYYDFYFNQYNTEENGVPTATPAFKALLKLSENVGWWCSFDGLVILTEKPKGIYLDTRDRLHNETGPAIHYNDGFAIYCYHGVVVDDYVIENPEKITVQDIEKESNVEVRRVKIKMFGEDKYLEQGGHEKVHEDDWGTLFKKDIKGDEPMVMVKVINSHPEPDGSYKDFFIRVPPDIKTAHEAVAWTFEQADYAPDQQT